jgi:hypothetical protein
MRSSGPSPIRIISSEPTLRNTISSQVRILSHDPPRAIVESDELLLNGETKEYELDFAWNEASPKFIGLIGPGVVVSKIKMYLLTAFDGIGASLSVGDDGDHNRLMATTDNDPQDAETYIVHPTYSYLTSTMINLYIVPGAGATKGNGTLLIYIIT